MEDNDVGPMSCDEARDLAHLGFAIGPNSLRAATLNILHSPDKPGLTRLRARRKGAKRDAGWIVVANEQMKNNQHFGDLKFGTLVDGFGRAADAPALVAAGIDHLAKAGANIIVANFLHAAWARACRRSSMIAGPSNYWTSDASSFSTFTLARL